MVCKITSIQDKISAEIAKLTDSPKVFTEEGRQIISELTTFLNGLETASGKSIYTADIKSGPREPTITEKKQLKDLEVKLKAEKARLAKELSILEKAKVEALKSKEEEARLAKVAQDLEVKRKAQEAEAKKAKDLQDKIHSEAKASREALRLEAVEIGKAKKLAEKERADKSEFDRIKLEQDNLRAKVKAEQIKQKEIKHKELEATKLKVKAEKEAKILHKNKAKAEAKAERQAKISKVKTIVVDNIKSTIQKIKDVISSIIAKIKSIKDSLLVFMSDFNNKRKAKKLVKGLPIYYSKLFDLINGKQDIVLDMDIGFAKKVIYDEMVKGQIVRGTAYKNKIHLPDFESLKNNKEELNSFIKTIMGDSPSPLITPKSILTLIDQHIEAEKTHSVKLHEAIHVATVQFMKAFPNDSKTIAINNLYKKMLKIAEDPNHISNTSNNGYWKTNVFEFVAESLSDEILIKALNDITVGNESFLHKLLSVFRKILGLTNGNATDVLLNTVLKMNDTRSPFNNYNQDYLIPTKGSTMEMKRVDEWLGMVSRNTNQGTNISDIIENVKFFGTSKQFLIKVGMTEGEFMSYVKVKLGGKPSYKESIDSKTRTELAKIPNTKPLMYSNDTSKTTKYNLFINVKAPLTPTETYLTEYFKDVKVSDKFLNGLTPEDLLESVKGVVDTSLVNSTRVSIIQYNDVRDTIISTVANRFLDGKALTDDIVEDISKSESKRKNVSVTRDKNGNVIKLDMSNTETKNKNSKSTTETTEDETNKSTSEGNTSKVKEVSRATSNIEGSNVETNETINRIKNEDNTSSGNSKTTEFDIDETHTIKNSRVVTNKTVNVSGTSISEDGGGNVEHKSGSVKKHYILENSLQIQTLITNGSINEDQRVSTKPKLDNLLSTDTTARAETFEYNGTNISIYSYDGVDYSFSVKEEDRDSFSVSLRDGLLLEVGTVISEPRFVEFERAMNKLGASYYDFDSTFSTKSNKLKQDQTTFDENMVEYNKNSFNGTELSRDEVLKKVEIELKKVTEDINIEFVVDHTEYRFDSSYATASDMYFSTQALSKPRLGKDSITFPKDPYILLQTQYTATNKLEDSKYTETIDKFSAIGVDVGSVYSSFLPNVKITYIAESISKIRFSPTIIPLNKALSELSVDETMLEITDGTGYGLQLSLFDELLYMKLHYKPLPTKENFNPPSDDISIFFTSKGTSLYPIDMNEVSLRLSKFNTTFDEVVSEYYEAITKQPKTDKVDSNIDTSRLDEIVNETLKNC